MKMIEKDGLKISSNLFTFINNEAIPGTSVDSNKFWSNFSEVVHELTPINKELIEKRESIQKKIDEWHKLEKGPDFDKNKCSNGIIQTIKPIIISKICGNIWGGIFWANKSDTSSNFSVSSHKKTNIATNNVAMIVSVILNKFPFDLFIEVLFC